MLMKEMNKDLNKWKDTLCSWIRSLNIVKNVTSPQSGFSIFGFIFRRLLFYIQTDLHIYCSFNHIPAGLLVDTDKLTLSFKWTGKRTRITKRIVKKNQCLRLIA